MIDITAIEQPDRRRVVCLTIIDGKEYARLVAFANALNGFPGLETDNTAATVYANFFAFPCNLDDDAGEAAAQIAESIDLGDVDDQEERRKIHELTDVLTDAAKAGEVAA